MDQTAAFGISQAGLTAVVWTLTGLSTLLVIGRLIIRTVVVNRFYWDDFFALFAYTLMLVSSALWMILIPTSYEFAEALMSGEMDKVPSLLDKILHYNVIMQTFFWTILFCTKFSFLFLYKLVLGQSTPKSYLYVWYGACAFCVVSYGITLINVYASCGNAADIFNQAVCNSEETARWTQRWLWTDFAFQMATDLLVILLPMPVLFGLNMRTSQKLSVAAVCCLAVATMAFEILRTIKIHTNDNTFLTILYSLLEEEVAVVIVMLPSYRFFISNTEKSRQYRRLLFSRLTLKSSGSTHSGFALHSVGRSEEDRSQAAQDIKVSTTISTHASASQDSVRKEHSPYVSKQNDNAV